MNSNILVPFLIGAFALKASAALFLLPGNLLTNPGFETGDLSGWTVGGKNGGIGVLGDGIEQPVTSALQSDPSFFFQSWQVVNSGIYAAYAITAGNGQPLFSEVGIFSQSIVVLEAGFHRIGFSLASNTEIGGAGLSDALNDQRLAIFVDGNYVPFDEPDFSTPFGLDGVASPTFVELSSEIKLTGAHDIEFRVSGSGTKRAGMSVDDFFVTQVPEPSSALLLVLSTSLLFRRRRA